MNLDRLRFSDVHRKEHVRILYAATDVPVPTNSGHAIRTLALIRGLAEAGHDLTFVSLAASSVANDLAPLSSYCKAVELVEVRLGNLSRRSDYVKRASSLLQLKSYSVERFRAKLMSEKIHSLLRLASYDLIFCDSIYSLVNVPETTVPTLLNCHNVEHLILRRYARLERNPLTKLYALLEAMFLRLAEMRAFRRCRAALVCSAIDRNLLKELAPNCRCFVVPNVVDTDALSAVKDAPNPSSPMLLYQGGMDWFPNRDAVDYFVRAILPLIRSEIPEVRFCVAGRNPPLDFVERLQSAGVEFTGTVQDVRPYLESAHIVVVPLRIGGGTRIKILEAAASRRPIVSTTIGAEGLELRNGKEILLADDPNNFSNAVVQLLQDRTLRENLIVSARNVVIERYSEFALKRILSAVLESISE